MTYPQDMSDSRLLLRPARAEDAPQAVALLVEAIDHIALALAGVERHEQAWPLFEQLFRQGGQRYGHEHVLVLQAQDRLVGAVLAYPGRDEVALAAPLRSLVGDTDTVAGFEAESAADEYYLDALAVAADQRGRGHAQRLIEAVCGRALERGFSRVGLLADLAKPRLQDWYAALGFIADGTRRIAGHDYRHRVRGLLE